MIICRFFRRPRVDNSVVSREILPKFELIQAFTHVLNNCKNEEDKVKNDSARDATKVANSSVHIQIWLKFEII